MTLHVWMAGRTNTDMAFSWGASTSKILHKTSYQAALKASHLTLHCKR